MMRCLGLVACMFLQSLHVTNSREPACSQFHYEEQMLEKVVRMGINMEQAMKRLDVFDKELRSKTQNIQDMLDDFGKLHTKVMVVLDNITSSGSTYVRWGRSTCPTVDGVSRIYEGFAAGTSYAISGGGANYICLPKVPELATSVMTAQYTSTIHGAEYQTHSSTLHSSLVLRGVF
ncbi:hypothetical protein DPMN_066046 [Dreissena polymorpha]|uniref:Uncharacterized protein n=1 Tax=Dreissena polymorpha TaxID=45954 RepID=A0A9D3YSR7_DREPO|nr:hypothetical protein DPMN_066046 [Dreissena polymorpha]